MRPSPAEAGLLASDPVLVRRFRWFSRSAAAAATVVGVAVLAGWALDVTDLKSLGPGLVSMKPNTALGLALLGVSLGALTATDPGGRRRRVGGIAAAVAAAIGLLTLLEYGLGWDLRVDQLLFSDAAGALEMHPGRMAAATAACLLALGGALLFSGAGRHRASGILGSLVGLTAFVAFLGYLYRVPGLYRLPDQPGMAAPTALILLVTAVGVMVLHPERLAISARNSGGILLRRLFPAMVLALVVLGWLQVEAQRGEAGSTLGPALAVAVRVVVLSGLIAWTAGSLRKVEQGRLAAERALRDLNLELEDRVRVRTAELAESEERFRLLADTAPVGIYRRDAGGGCTYVNQAWSTITGLSPAQAMDGGWLDAVHPDERELELESWAEAASGRVDRHRRHRLLTPEGVEKWVDSLSVPIRETAGGPIHGYVGTMIDVSAQVRAESAVAEARDQAVDASRSKSEFLATMSHEIRTPMNGVIGLTGLLLDTELTGAQRSYAEGVRTSGEALLGIINDILDFSKIEAGKLEIEDTDFNLAYAVEQVATLVSEPARAKGLELVAYCSPELPATVRGDVGRLRQILLNLATNAVKFTKSGEVVLRAYRQEEPGAEGVVVRFEVTDTGPGVHQADIDRIFEPFAQADASTTRRFGGTGLGLAISRRLATAMGGTLGVESRPGLGSTFWLRMPFADAREPARSGRRSAEILQGLRVLVVDDNRTNRGVLATHLQSWGVTAGTAASAEEALTCLQSSAAESTPYHLVLVDMVMPGMSGLELAGILRADDSLRPVGLILMTSESDDAGAAEEAGFVATLSKPVRVSQLYNALASALAPSSEAGPAGGTAAVKPRELRGTLLIVEDHPINQEVARGLAARLGYSSDLAANGIEALAALEKKSYDAVLMDCHMPEMDGFQATEEIRRRQPDRHTPIIAMTAGALVEDREKCIAAGMDDYLAKPINDDELARVLGRWIAAGRAKPGAEGSNRRTDRTNGVLDLQQLESLRGLASGGAGPLAGLIDLFLEQAAAAIRELPHASARGDHPAVRRLAHSLKGSAATMGAPGAASACATLEQAAENGNENEEAVDLVINELEKAATALRSLAR